MQAVPVVRQSMYQALRRWVRCGSLRKAPSASLRRARKAPCLPVLAAALWLACSAGGSLPDGGRDSDDVGLTGNENLGRIEGRVTIGPLCPVERIPPDPRCSPKPELFAAVKVRILTTAGELVRLVDLDDSGNYAVELESGSYLVDTNYRGFGLPGGPESGTGGTDSASSAPGSPSTVDPTDPIPTPGEPPPPVGPPFEPPLEPPFEPPFPTDSFPTDSGVVFPDSGYPGVPPESVPSRPPPFPGDSGPPYVEDPGEDGGPYRVLPVAVQVQAGRTLRVDIDIDTGIR